MEIQDKQACIDLLEREEWLDQQEVEIQRRADVMKGKKTPGLKDDVNTRTADWVHQSRGRKIPDIVSEVKQTTGNLNAQKAGLGALSASTTWLHQLEQEVADLKKDRSGHDVKATEMAIRQLKEMGLMPMNVPDELFSLPRQVTTQKDK